MFSGSGKKVANDYAIYGKDVQLISGSELNVGDNPARIVKIEETIDGNAKMSKSLGNGIYLSDTREDLYKKVMKMYTDSNHIRIEDPGHIENNIDMDLLEVRTRKILSYSNIIASTSNILEVGTGTGLISLMLAQRNSNSQIFALDIDDYGSSAPKPYNGTDATGINTISTVG